MVGRYLIHGIDYVGGNFQEVVDFIEDAHNDKAACLIGFAPMTSAAEAIRNKKFRDTLNGFDIVCMDGASIVKRAKGAHYCVPERCSGPDVMTEIIRRAAYMGTTHYLYGTNKETLQKLKKYLESEGAYVAGAMAPPFPKNNGKPVNGKTRFSIRQSNNVTRITSGFLLAHQNKNIFVWPQKMNCLAQNSWQ